jgi:hypothetical protein
MALELVFKIYRARHANCQPQLAAGVLCARAIARGGKVKSRTLANISDWPEAKIDSLRRVLAGETLVPLAAERFEIARALAARPRRRCARDGRPARARQGVAKGTRAPGQADPRHDRGAGDRTGRQAGDGAPAQRGDRRHSLGAVLGLGEVDEDELYATLDLLGLRAS